MTLPLTPEMLEACYDFLRTTPPFCKWNLPHGEDVTFQVGRRPREAGRYVWDPNTKRHYIIASIHGVGHTCSLTRFMSHEMTHLHLQVTGMESPKRSEEVHNAAFRKFAAQICRWHGFDLKAFY